MCVHNCEGVVCEQGWECDQFNGLCKTVGEHVCTAVCETDEDCQEEGDWMCTTFEVYWDGQSDFVDLCYPL
jgi:hypothetical protein